MPKRSNDFQTLVTLINGCLCKSARVEESALLVDRRNREKREVDILISSLIGDYPIRISVEVRDRKRKADTGWIEQMYAKHRDLPTDKLVLVSRSGFCKPALEKARSYDVEAISFEEALDTDWDLATRMTSSGFIELTTLKLKWSAVCAYPDGNKVYSPVSMTTHVFMPKRDTPTDFQNMRQKILQVLLNEQCFVKALNDLLATTDQRRFTLLFTPSSGTYVLDKDRVRRPLLKFSADVEVERTNTPMTFSAGRYRRSEVIFGQSSEPMTRLYFVLVRKERGQVEGLLYDDTGIRTLGGASSPAASALDLH